MIPRCMQRLLILLTLHGYKPPWPAWPLTNAVFYILDVTRLLLYQYFPRYIPTQSVVTSFPLSHTVVIYRSHYCQQLSAMHVFTLTQLLLKQVNVQTPYRVVSIKVVILVFVPSKSTYDRYWNLIPLSRRQYDKRHRSYRESTASVYEETLWTKRLFLL